MHTHCHLQAVLPARAVFFDLAEHESITTAAGLCNFSHLEVLMKNVGSEGLQYCDPWSNTTFLMQAHLKHICSTCKKYDFSSFC